MSLKCDNTYLEGNLSCTLRADVSIESRKHVALSSLPFKMKLFEEKNGWWLVTF